ncbi:hypothetical protein [Catenovulum agarivorans]|uniref:hypothetical protein n=1 Tax=Catenovulum agarivorans TaxID=1172192 RepID=UPI000368AD24|nr:hypothetical protein [Catenovulum agarivorans]
MEQFQKDINSGKNVTYFAAFFSFFAILNSIFLSGILTVPIPVYLLAIDILILLSGAFAVHKKSIIFSLALTGYFLITRTMFYLYLGEIALVAVALNLFILFHIVRATMRIIQIDREGLKAK